MPTPSESVIQKAINYCHRLNQSRQTVIRGHIMSETLTAGLAATRHVQIDRDRTISFMGDDCRVYSTPNLLYDVEMVCRDLLLLKRAGTRSAPASNWITSTPHCWACGWTSPSR
jgi:hypothetical protein